MQPSPLLSASPSFNSYSSDRLAEIAAKVIEEEATREPEARGSDNKPPSEGSSHGQEQQEEHDHEEEDEDEDDFEFPFVFIDPNGSPSSADEIFYKGHLQPTFPVFNRDLLVADDHGEDSSSAKAPVSPVRLPLGKLFIAEGDPQSSSSSEADELERVPPGTYCAWRPNSAEASPDRCKKSNSTGSLKKWRLRDLVNRSSSDGKDAFVFLPPSTVKTNTGTKKESKPESSKERRNSGDVKLDGNMKFTRRQDIREISMDSASQRRLKAIQGHLISAAGDSQSQLRTNETAGEFVSVQGYSVVLPEKLQTGKWNVYRSARSPLNLVSRFPDNPEIGTLHDNFVRSVDTFRDYKYLGTRIRVDGTIGDYKWMTYGEAGTARSAIGSGLVHHGIPKGAFVGLYFINRPEWLIVDHACSAYSYISVPLYDTLGPDAVKYIVNHAGVQAIFCVPQTLNILLSFLSELCSVRLIAVIGGMDEHIPSLPSTSGVVIISYSKLLSQGHNDLQPFCPPKPDDLATICYTSGTTGTPKGVMLTHGNFIANIAGATLTTKFYPSDVYISYLPLAHIYERANQVMTVYFGVAIGFYQGDNMKLMDDMAALRPTIFCSVPRLYNRIYAGITNAVKTSGVLRERLFNAAYNAKKQAILNGRNPSPMWDRLVFNKIKEKLGGRVRYMVSGASPLSPDILDFLRICFGGQVVEGYGMTETSCVISAMDEGDNLSGHVGSPNPACEIKLMDVPEMNYTSEDEPHPRGEICVRGPIIFQGYYKDEVQTREVIDEDGWLHTGDIGLWLPGGCLKIIDRKKNIFKLAQGEYIAPEKIENVYAKCKFVAQCFVYGDSLNSCLVAVVSVDQDVLKAWASSEGIKYEDIGQLCNDPRTRKAVLADMDAVGREAQLRGFEFAKSVTLVPEPFTIENGLLTPTLKIKRPQAKAYFADAISKMYAEIATSDPTPEKTL